MPFRLLGFSPLFLSLSFFLSALREAMCYKNWENKSSLHSFVIDSAAGYDKQSFIAQPVNNGNKTSSPFYQIQYLPSLVREHTTIKPPILPSVFLSPTHNLFKQCCLILWNLLGNVQHWKCLPYSVLCPTNTLFKKWRRMRVFLDCKFIREVLNFFFFAHKLL